MLNSVQSKAPIDFYESRTKFELPLYVIIFDIHLLFYIVSQIYR